MSSTTITIMRCDRCGHETDPASAAASNLLDISALEPRAAGWGKIAAFETSVVDRKRVIGGVGQQGDDLCPGCIEALFVWWQTPGDVAQPAPPPPTPPRPRPMFTIEDRSALARTIEVAMRGQAAVACEAYRDQPTAAVQESDLAEAYEGIDDRAFTLAREVIEQLEADR